MFERLFHLSENNTTVQREIVGGMTTFFTMSYIIFVQPAILSATGMDFDSVMAATCLSSAAATLLMAFLANYPIALAPAMGHNVFFAFVVCQGMGIPWRTALGAVCISGLLFIALSAFGVRRAIMNLIPYSLKMAIGVGIGLMIALLGFQWAGVVVDNPATLIAIGSLTKPYVYVSGAGLLAASILIALRIRGAILIGMAVSAALGLFMGLLHFQGVYSAPPSLEPTFFQLQPFQALKLGLFTIIFVFLILDLFDTIGTLVAVAELGGFMKNGEMERAQPALLSDAIGTVFGALMGTSTVTSYVESSSGISDGARTGLASVVTAILFLLALFFAPLARMLGAGIELPGGATVYPVIAPALIVVGFMMMRAVKTIPWDDPSESIPAFLTIVLIAFSFSITEGIAFGVISYTVLKLATGRFKDLNVTLLILTAMFIFRYFFMKF